MFNFINDSANRCIFKFTEGTMSAAEHSHPYGAAFTLAEVLITLGIIGVVAAMTLPTLINNFKHREYITRAKRSASIIANALTAMQAEYEDTSFETINDTFTNSQDLADALGKHLKVIKKCRVGEQGCHDEPIKQQSPHDIDGSGTAGYYSNGGFRTLGYPQLVLADGSILSFMRYSTCIRTYMGKVTDADGNVVTDASGTVLMEEKPASACWDIGVDTNGSKKPNQIGVDIFWVFVNSDKIAKESRGSLVNILYAEQINAVDYTPGSEIH